MEQQTNGKRRLPQEIKIVWYIETAILAVVLVGICIGLLVLTNKLGFSYWWLGTTFAISVFLVVLDLIFVPFRWKRWQFQIRDGEIEIEEGVLFSKRTLIPMVRIQHVKTEQGPLLRAKKLVQLSISTAADPHKIPAVSACEVDALRLQILALVKEAREDV